MNEEKNEQVPNDRNRRGGQLRCSDEMQASREWTTGGHQKISRDGGGPPSAKIGVSRNPDAESRLASSSAVSRVFYNATRFSVSIFDYPNTQKLHHENLVNMIQVFRRRKRFYLVFEYLDHTLLDELETVGGRGLDWQVSRGHIYQVLRGLSFCHARNVSCAPATSRLDSNQDSNRARTITVR